MFTWRSLSIVLALCPSAIIGLPGCVPGEKTSPATHTRRERIGLPGCVPGEKTSPATHTRRWRPILQSLELECRARGGEIPDGPSAKSVSRDAYPALVANSAPGMVGVALLTPQATHSKAPRHHPREFSASTKRPYPQAAVPMRCY